MKVTFNLDNGANIHSCRSETWDLSKKNNDGFGYSEAEWKELSEKEKDEVVYEWAMQYCEYYYEEST